MEILIPKSIHTLQKEVQISHAMHYLKMYVSSRNMEENHPLMSALYYNTISPVKAGEVMSSFYFAVMNWKNHLKKFRKTIIDAKIDEMGTGECCALLNENINDENGDGDLTKQHTVTYVNFLHALGYSGQLKMSSAVDDFNAGLSNCLHNDSLARHALTLAAIEYAYIHVSTIISNYCSLNGIEQEHYANHEELDKEHAEGLIKVGIILEADKADFIGGINEGYALLHDALAGLME